MGGLGGPRAGVDGLCSLCCGVAVRGPFAGGRAISLPEKSVVVGEVG